MSASETPFVEEALAASTEVALEAGRWVVYVNVLLASGAVRKRLSDHHDERRANIAARAIEQNLQRTIRNAAAFGTSFAPRLDENLRGV